MQLRDNFAGFGPQRTPLRRGLSVGLGARTAAFVFLDVAAPDNPAGAQRREAVADAAQKRRVAPWAAAIINAHGRVGFGAAVAGLGGVEVNLPEGHLEAWWSWPGT